METDGPQVLTLVVRALRWAIEPSHSVESLTACEYGFGISPPSPTREFHSLGKAIAILNRMRVCLSLYFNSSEVNINVKHREILQCTEAVIKSQ
jgi:hypothetical protein